MRRATVTCLILLALAVAGCFSSPNDSSKTGTRGETKGPGNSGFLPDPQLAISGLWEAPFDGEVPAINMVVLHNGNILYWSGVEANSTDGATQATFFTAAPVDGQSRVLNLSGTTHLIIIPENPGGAGDDLFCAGQTVLPDGRVLAVGASQWRTIPTTEPFLRGGTDARIFNPDNNTWERKADMLFGRWYPSAITLPDGRALVASGVGSLTNFNEQWPQIETYDPATDEWTYMEGADRLLPLYARITVVPGGPLKGSLFYNTVGTLWGPFGEHPEQATWSLQAGLNLDSPAWTEKGLSSYGARQHAASVMRVLDPSREHAPEFVTFGGTLYQSTVAIPFAETIDLATDPPTNARVANMNDPRWHLNGVLLPDDTILAVGGGRYDNVIVHGQDNVPTMSAELYNPEADTWTKLASMSVPRMYHSTAVLLPDGRVLAAGHVPLPNPFTQARDTVNPQIAEKRFEIFNPPYLFRGPRPVIESAPAHSTYGANITVDVDQEETIREVILLRPGATTHAYDSEQRGVRLPFSVVEGKLAIQTPPDSTVAPPGYYMMFVMGEGNGGLVPSVASFIHLA